MSANNLIIILFLLVIVILFISIRLFKKKQKGITQRRKLSADELLPKRKVRNDKLILVDNITNEEIEKIIKDFCNLYNDEKYQALPRVYSLKNNKYAITFPFDIDFEIYCYCINYISYPSEFNKTFDVIGWTTANASDNWITSLSANKKVMIYISPQDTEGDNVFLTTNDNIGYKLGFALGEEKQLLDNPHRYFKSRDVEILDLVNYKDYK